MRSASPASVRSGCASKPRRRSRPRRHGCRRRGRAGAPITFDGSSLLALEVRDVSLEAGEPTARRWSMPGSCASACASCRCFPAMSGLPAPRSPTPASWRRRCPRRTASDWTAALRNDEGLIDPDRVVEACSAGPPRARRGASRDRRTASTWTMSRFVLPEDGRIGSDHGSSARRFPEAGPGKLAFLRRSRDRRPRRDARRFGGARSGFAAHQRCSTSQSAAAGAAEPASRRRTGQRRAEPPRRDRPQAFRQRRDRRRAGSRLAGGADAARIPALDLGSARRPFRQLDFAGQRSSPARTRSRSTGSTSPVGRTISNFNGAVGPKPPSGEAGEEPAYRYRTVSSSATLAPDGSPEPALDFTTGVSGVYLTGRATAGRRRDRDQERRAARRSARPRSISSTGKAPGIAAAPSRCTTCRSRMSSSCGRGLRRARRGSGCWRTCSAAGSPTAAPVQVEPGRLGNGVPLSPEEVFGRFAIEGTRFDTAGLIPPVRDAVGVVDFRGNDVDIALSSGTVFLPSGRTVAASNGTLTDQEGQPAAGDRRARHRRRRRRAGRRRTRLLRSDQRHALHRPGARRLLRRRFRAMSRPTFRCRRASTPSKLDWLVALDYKDLSMAKPIDGQMVTEADGTITVDPDKAVISAKAKLNGVAGRDRRWSSRSATAAAERERMVSARPRRQGARSARAGHFATGVGHRSRSSSTCRARQAARSRPI